MTLNHLLQIAGVLLLLYALVSGIYLVLENRSPQSTFAWLFFFITIPVLGVVVYQFVGRGWRAFSKGEPTRPARVGRRTAARSAADHRA